MTRKGWLILMLSLTVNGLLGGILLGQYALTPTHALGERPLRQMMHNLPPEMRPILRQALGAQRVELQAALQESRHVLLHLQQLSRDPQVQEASLRAGFQQLQQSLDHLQHPVYEAMIQTIMTTPVEVRRHWQALTLPPAATFPAIETSN